MNRRRLLGLVAGAVGLGGCSARALPSPDLGGSTPAAGCPAVLDVDRRVCPGDDEGPLTVERSSATVDGDRWSLVVSVANRTDEQVGANPYAWSVYRRESAGWRQVTPGVPIEPRMQLAPGDRYAWQLTAGDAHLDDADQRVILDLAPGRYAFAVPLLGPGRIGAVAPFAVTA